MRVLLPALQVVPFRSSTTFLPNKPAFISGLASATMSMLPSRRPTPKRSGVRVGRRDPRDERHRPEGGGMTEDARDLARRVQDQTVDSARGFFGASLGRLKAGLRDERS